MVTGSFLTPLLATTFITGSTFLLAGLGELIAERSGVLNLGVQGIMSVGGFTGFVVTVISGDPYMGLLAGTGCGLLFAYIHAFLSITLKVDQVISGLMITLLGTGLTDYFTADWSAKSINGLQNVTLPIVGKYLVSIPVVGPALFRTPATDFVAVALVPITWYFLNYTNLGLEITAVGEDPASADSMGIHVFRLQYLAVLLGGALGGAAGAHLVLAYTQLWSSGIIGGAGWIAIALVIFAQWRAERILLGAYLFGVVDMLQLRIPSLHLSTLVPAGTLVGGVVTVLTTPSIMSTYPYIFTILVLVFVSARTSAMQLGAPAQLLKSYIREAE